MKEPPKGESSDSTSSSSETDLEASIPRQHSTPMKSSHLSQKSPVNKKPQPDTESSDSSSSEEEESKQKASTQKAEKPLEVQSAKNARTASSSSESSSSEESTKGVGGRDKPQVVTAAKAPVRQASSTSSSDSSSDEDGDVGKGSKVTTSKQAKPNQDLQETQSKEKKATKKKNEASSVGGASSNKPGVKMNSASPAKVAGTAAGGKSSLKPPSNGVKAKGVPVDSSDSSESDSDADSATTPSAASTPLSEFQIAAYCVRQLSQVKVLHRSTTDYYLFHKYAMTLHACVPRVVQPWGACECQCGSYIPCF